jgi:hypothetical protein
MKGGRVLSWESSYAFPCHVASGLTMGAARGEALERRVTDLEAENAALRTENTALRTENTAVQRRLDLRPDDN